MAAVEFSVSELRALAGRAFPLAQLCEYAEALGMPVEVAGEDALSIDVTPNRPDMLGIEGFARALAAFTGVRKGLREYGAERSGVAVRIEQSVKSVRPFIVAAVVKAVPAATHASLIQMQEKLHDTLGRKRRKVSIGVHDFAAVQPPLVYKAAVHGTSFVPLGSLQEMTPAEILQRHPKGVEYAPILAGAAKYPMLSDAQGIISFPPIINAERTRVSAATKDLLIEVTGTSLDASHAALKIICAALADRGGKIFSVAVDGMHTPDMSAGSATLDVAAANKLLGSDISVAGMCGLLERMGYAAVHGKRISVKVPCYRTDVLAEADLIEDVAIAKGYGWFSPSLPSFFTPGAPSAQQERGNALRDAMNGLGFCEVLTQTLTNAKRNFDDALLKRSACVTIKNPVTEDFAIMRTWLLPSLLGVLATNKHAAMPQRIYELGEAVLLDAKSETGARTETRLCAAITHARAGFSEAKSLLEALLFEAGIAHALKAAEHATFIAGRAAKITCNGKEIGIMGEIHPQALENFALEHPVAAFEVVLE